MWKNKSEETMAKMVLIEAHPLLRLGLWQILSELDDIWEIQGMGWRICPRRTPRSRRPTC